MLSPDEYTNKIICGGALEVLRTLPDGCVDTIITDPPYGLRFMGKKWDYDIPATEVWAECLRVAKPGATLMAFGGTRTWHRLAVSIEDAGWDLFDTLSWLYGSGFPKAQDISAMIDKAAMGRPQGSANPESPNHGKYKGGCSEENEKGQGFGAGPGAFMQEAGEAAIHVPATPEARLWDGWKTHALKPAWEPIICARKPNEVNYVNNALKHRVAGLNIEGGRIGIEERKYRGSGAQPHKINNHGQGDTGIGLMDGSGKDMEFSATGRYPANVITGCACDGDQHDADCPVAILDEQSGRSTSAGGQAGNENAYSGGFKNAEFWRGIKPGFGDTGGASRFFYCAKASRAEREKGLEDKSEYQARGNGFSDKISDTKTPRGNHHPTVKPIALMKYLCTLTKTPTGGLVLDPFIGSGTTAIAATMCGRSYVGIELNPEYIEIAEKRIAAVGYQKELFA